MSFLEGSYPTLNEKLLSIFNCIRSHDLSLQTFIEAACHSDDEEVRRRVSIFGSRSGPGKILKLWMERFPDLNTDPNLKDISTSVLSETICAELNMLGSQSQFRCSTTEISLEEIERFSLKDIGALVTHHAPSFDELLRSLIRSDPNKRPEILLAVITSMIMYNRSERASSFQKIIGIHLFSARCPSSVVTLLQRMSISTSRHSVKRSLETLTKNAISQIKHVTNNPFGLLYDNINMANRKFDQRLDNKDMFESGVTATIIPGLDLGTPNTDCRTYSPLTAEDLALDSDEDEKHMSEIATFHLIDVLQRTFGPLPIDSTISPVRQLPAVKTPTHPLPIMMIDQSTLEGNLRILKHVMEVVADKPEEYFDFHDIIIMGDLLTVARVWGLQTALENDISRYKRMEWAIPVFQLFHTQMMLAQLILHTHSGKESVPGSLEYNKSLLGRNRISVDNLSFHDVDELLRHSFDAMVLRLWEVILDLDEGMTMERMLKTTEKDELNAFIHAKAKVMASTYLNSTAINRQSNSANINSSLFIRDMIYHIELAAAIKVGDVGRIEQILRWVTIMTQAGTTSNYGHELLNLQFGLRHEWTAERKEAIT
ncbi:hypothetical protein BGW38_007323, partial [Lunasporangiospora selenospora]